MSSTTHRRRRGRSRSSGAISRSTTAGSAPWANPGSTSGSRRQGPGPEVERVVGAGELETEPRPGLLHPEVDELRGHDQPLRSTGARLVHRGEDEGAIDA